MAENGASDYCPERDRFQLDLEFVQCLASSEYEAWLYIWNYMRRCGTPKWSDSTVLQVPELVSTKRLLG